MDILKKGGFLVVIAFLVIIPFVSALNYDILGFWESYYQIVDFFIFFMCGILISNLTIGKALGEKSGDEKSANILSIVIGVICGITIVAFEQFQFEESIFLQPNVGWAVFLVAIAVTWFMTYLAIVKLGEMISGMKNKWLEDKKKKKFINIFAIVLASIAALLLIGLFRNVAFGGRGFSSNFKKILNIMPWIWLLILGLIVLIIFLIVKAVGLFKDKNGSSGVTSGSNINLSGIGKGLKIGFEGLKKLAGNILNLIKNLKEDTNKLGISLDELKKSVDATLKNINDLINEQGGKLDDLLRNQDEVNKFITKITGYITKVWEEIEDSIIKLNEMIKNSDLANKESYETLKGIIEATSHGIISKIDRLVKELLKKFDEFSKEPDPEKRYNILLDIQRLCSEIKILIEHGKDAAGNIKILLDAKLEEILQELERAKKAEEEKPEETVPEGPETIAFGGYESFKKILRDSYTVTQILYSRRGISGIPKGVKDDQRSLKNVYEKVIARQRELKELEVYLFGAGIIGGARAGVTHYIDRTKKELGEKLNEEQKKLIDNIDTIILQMSEPIKSLNKELKDIENSCTKALDNKNTIAQRKYYVSQLNRILAQLANLNRGNQNLRYYARILRNQYISYKRLFRGGVLKKL